MKSIPKNVAEFLSRKVMAVAGVSRDPNQPANAIFRKLKASGYTVYAVNPKAGEVEGVKAYPDIASLPEKAEAAVIVTPPSASAEAVRQCLAAGIDQIWLHRSFGEGSVSEEAVRECERSGVNCLVGGCPMMYCNPVDFGHKCMRWILNWQGKVPG